MHRASPPPLSPLQPACNSAPSQTTSNIVCAGYERPHVAICLGGTARTLEQPLVYRTIRSNLVEAFGGETTAFANIMMGDQRSSVRKVVTINASEAGVLHALTHIGVARRNLHIRPGLFDDSPYRDCARTISGSKTMRALGTVRFASIVGQLSARRACYDLIVQDEQRRERRFDFIIFLRADLSWPTAIAPYCFWDLTTSFKKNDHVFFLTRANASIMLRDGPEVLFRCKRKYDQSMSIEDYAFKDFDLDELSDGISSIVTRQNTKDTKLAECRRLGRNARDFIGFPRGLDCQARELPSSDEKAVTSGWTMIESHAVNQLCLKTTSHNPCANTVPDLTPPIHGASGAPRND